MGWDWHQCNDNTGSVYLWSPFTLSVWLRDRPEPHQSIVDRCQAQRIKLLYWSATITHMTAENIIERLNCPPDLIKRRRMNGFSGSHWTPYAVGPCQPRSELDSQSQSSVRNSRARTPLGPLLFSWAVQDTDWSQKCCSRIFTRLYYTVVQILFLITDTLDY